MDLGGNPIWAAGTQLFLKTRTTKKKPRQPIDRQILETEVPEEPVTPLPIQGPPLEEPLDESSASRQEDISGDEQEETQRICPTCRVTLTAGLTHTCREPGPIPEPPTVGTMFESIYELTRVIASGGMGLVYEARDHTTEQTVAIKMLHAHMLSDAFVMRFQREGKAASQLSHPNLLKVYELGVTDNNQPYMVMEFVPGYSLSDEIRRSPISLKRALPIFVQICDALAHAHQRGVLHRDLKPSNILITREADGKEVVKIVDFGIAKVLDDDGKITRTGQVLGSPAYMSPEQCSGAHVDNRSDIYSLGCLMFETLTGKPPFVSESSLKIIMHHRTTVPPTIASFMTDVEIPPALDEIFKKIFSKQPEQRYQTVDELKVALLALDDSFEGELKKRAKPKKKSRKRDRLFKVDREMIMVASVVLGSVVLASGAAFFLTFETRKPDSNQETPQPLERPNSDAEAVTRDKLRLADKLDFHKITDQDMLWYSSIAESVPDLPLSGSLISDQGIPNFSRNRELPALIRVSLEHTAIGDATCSSLSRFPNLTELNLKYTNVTDSGAVLISKLRNLKELRLDGTKISDFGARTVTSCPNLTELSLAWTRVTDACCSSIAGLQQLKRLNVSGTRVSNNGMQKLCELRTLTHLDVSSTDIDDRGVESIIRIESLEELNLAYTPITGKSLQLLAKMPSLIKLELKGTKLSDKTITAFNPVTERLSLCSTSVGDGIGSRLAKLDRLGELNLSYTNVTDGVLPHLVPSLALAKLELDGDNITDAGMKSLAAMRALEEVSLRRTKVSDVGLLALVNSKTIAKVSVHNCKNVTRRGVRKAIELANDFRKATNTPTMRIEFD